MSQILYQFLRSLSDEDMGTTDVCKNEPKKERLKVKRTVSEGVWASWEAGRNEGSRWWGPVGGGPVICWPALAKTLNTEPRGGPAKASLVVVVEIPDVEKKKKWRRRSRRTFRRITGEAMSITGALSSVVSWRRDLERVECQKASKFNVVELRNFPRVSSLDNGTQNLLAEQSTS